MRRINANADECGEGDEDEYDHDDGEDYEDHAYEKEPDRETLWWFS